MNEEAPTETIQPETKPHRKKSGRPRGSANKKKRIEALEKQIERLRGHLAAANNERPPEPEPKIDKGAKDRPVKGAPPMPKMDKLAGDKTPEVVEWYKEYWPEEYQRRYVKRSRKTHLRRSFRLSRDRAEEEDEENVPGEARAGKEMVPTREGDLDTEPRSYSYE